MTSRDVREAEELLNDLLPTHDPARADAHANIEQFIWHLIQADNEGRGAVR